MKIFVTGGTGFVGSHFLNAAHRAGSEIIALRRRPESRARVPLEVEPHWVDGDMEEMGPEVFQGCDVVVHLAAHTPNVPYDTLENCLRWNVLAPLRLFAAAVKAGVPRFVIAGSCFEYGRSGERYDFIPPDAPLEPTQTYPASKAAASVAFYQFAAETGVKLSIHRIFQVFGEGEAEGRLWPSLRRSALEGKDLDMTPAEQVRDFVPVQEVARQLFVACLRTDVAPGNAVIENLGTGIPQTLRAFAEDWWSKWSATGTLRFGVKPYRSGEVMRYVPLIRSQTDLAL